MTQVTLNTAPAHPHATWVAVYPALLFSLLLWPKIMLSFHYVAKADSTTHFLALALDA